MQRGPASKWRKTMENKTDKIPETPTGNNGDGMRSEYDFSGAVRNPYIQHIGTKLAADEKTGE